MMQIAYFLRTEAVRGYENRMHGKPGFREEAFSSDR